MKMGFFVVRNLFGSGNLRKNYFSKLFPFFFHVNSVFEEIGDEF